MIALVNFNVGLTLFRCEPLAEYKPVGSSLTTRRKEEAETGQTHQRMADIDVLKREREGIDTLTFTCGCLDPHFLAYADVVSLDTWEELLDPPPCVGVSRAKDNWAARLAAVSILIQQELHHVAIIVDGDRVCWRCLKETYAEPEPHFPQVLIY